MEGKNKSLISTISTKIDLKSNLSIHVVFVKVLDTTLLRG